MRIDIMTLFPEFVDYILSESIIWIYGHIT